MDYVNETAYCDPQTVPEPVQTAVAMTGSPVAQPPLQPAATMEPARDGNAATQPVTSADVGAPESGPKNEQIGAAGPAHRTANGTGAPASMPASAPVGKRDDQTEFSAVFDELIVPIVVGAMTLLAAPAVLRLAADRALPQPQRPSFIQYGLDRFGRHSCWFAGRRTDVDNGRVA